MNDDLLTHEVHPTKVMLGVGDLTHGIAFYGPFEDAQAALKWSRDNVKLGRSCWLSEYHEVKS